MSEIEVSTRGSVARFAFNRPKVLNALSPGMLETLIDLCAETAADGTIQVVQLVGEGASFSAGADLPAFLERLHGADAQEVADLGRRATEALAELPQITIAAVQGHCVGGGLVLAGACDVRIAADDARFLIPELDAGIPLGWGGMARVVRLVGETLAADLVLSCRPVDAEEAMHAGLVSRVVSADRLRDEVLALTEALVDKPPVVLRATKRQLLAIRAGTFDAREDANALLSALRDPEAREHGATYLARRLPRR